MTVLGYADGTWLIAALVLALYLLVSWMLLEGVAFRADRGCDPELVETVAVARLVECELLSACTASPALGRLSPLLSR